jgi:ATP-dependent exoDNAse (exonuclease V) alpha subunit
VQRGHLPVDEHTTIYLDEAGMGGTDRLDRLTKVIERTGCKLVMVGDAAQLPSIGAGGMFDRLSRITPSAEDPREELAFQHQLADYAQQLRQQGGGVTKAWKPDATPAEWAGD